MLEPPALHRRLGWVPGWRRGHLPLPAPAQVIRALDMGYWLACPPGLDSRVARTIAVP